MSSYSSSHCGEQIAPAGVAVLIATSEPGRALLDLVCALVQAETPAILVVDDGSAQGRQWVLNRIALEPTVHLLRHAKPHGRGAALKTGMKYFLDHLRHYTGVVTVTGDGQYAAQDVVRVACGLDSSPRSVILGARQYGNASASREGERRWRTPLGARMLRRFLRLFAGLDLIDAQTQLRALPTALLPRLLRIPGLRYDYELAMILHIAHVGYPLAEHAVAGRAESGIVEGDHGSIADSLAFVRALMNCEPIEAEAVEDDPKTEAALRGKRGDGAARARQTR